MVGRKMVVPRDFAWLSEKVEERTQQRVSASTLRRFWGYVNEGVTASKFTKNVLAIFLGYADFEEFVLLQGAGAIQRGKDAVKEVRTGFECGLVMENFNDIKEGDQIESFIMEEVPR